MITVGRVDALAALDGRRLALIREAQVHDGTGRRSDALLIDGDRIEAVGEAARVRAAALPAGALTEIALPGLTIVPGFIDAHTHLVHMGFGLTRLDLAGAPSAAAALERVRAALERRDPARPLIAEHWDDATWAPGDRLLRADLDRLARSTPVVLRRVCGHKAVMNGAALARLDAHPGGPAYDACGFIDAPAGTLIEDAAMRLAEVFPPDAMEVEAALAAALARAARRGVTGAHDIVTPDALRAEQAARQSGRLTLRLTAHLDIAHLEAAEELGLASGLGDAWLRLGGVKLYLDGSLGARTAALREPYADAGGGGRDGGRGLLLYEETKLAALVARLDGAGFTAVLHAIGDRAIATALAALESLGPAAVRERRHRIEHLELTPDDLLERVARSGATASMQPNFVAEWAGLGGMYERALGPARLAAMNRFRSLAERGVPLAFGSDCMPMDPLTGIAGAVAHPVARERLDPAAALAAYTQGSARAGFAERETGALEPGKLADFAVLDGDPLGAPGAARVVAAVAGGAAVFSAAAPPSPGAAS